MPVSNAQLFLHRHENVQWQNSPCSCRGIQQKECVQGLPGAVNSNDFADHRAAYKLAKVLMMQRRGSSCFDDDFYRSRSHDLPDWPPAQLWGHFVHDGQFEGRPFRCVLQQ